MRKRKKGGDVHRENDREKSSFRNKLKTKNYIPVHSVLNMYTDTLNLKIEIFIYIIIYFLC